MFEFVIAIPFTLVLWLYNYGLFTAHTAIISISWPAHLILIDTLMNATNELTVLFALDMERIELSMWIHI